MREGGRGVKRKNSGKRLWGTWTGKTLGFIQRMRDGAVTFQRI